jgi:hypothetical protein
MPFSTKSCMRSRMIVVISAVFGHLGLVADRFGESAVPQRAVLDTRLKLLRRQPGANLLLERKGADARVLHAIDLDAVDALTDGGPARSAARP